MSDAEAGGYLQAYAAMMGVKPRDGDEVTRRIVSKRRPRKR
jgi:hypothetical protein